MSGCQVGLGRGPGWGADLGVGGLSAVSQIGVGTWLREGDPGEKTKGRGLPAVPPPFYCGKSPPGGEGQPGKMRGGDSPDQVPALP